MKRDDQILSLRLQNEANRDRLVQHAKDRDRALNNNSVEVPLPLLDLQGEDGAAPGATVLDPSKIIIIHPGSQNLRIGFASDALPKTVTMTLATRFPQTESELHEPLPRRQLDGRTTEEKYGEEWSKKCDKMSNDLKPELRANKVQWQPKFKEQVFNFNRRMEAEVIPQHNDPLQMEWTDVESPDDPTSAAPCFYGQQALRIPDDSQPKFRLRWPMQHGWFNEDDYDTLEHLCDDFGLLLDHAIRQELGLSRHSQWKQYSCVFVIADLYDKKYVEQVLHSCMTWFDFSRVSFIQESMAATFGAGYTQACVVDVGAQKTSITCVEDGLCIEDSRINLKVGGYDVTETFIKLLLFGQFPYEDINLRRRYDFLLAEELKVKYCTMLISDIAVKTHEFHVRGPKQPTRKYQFRTYDEIMLAPLGFYEPSLFDNSSKLKGRRKLLDRSCNAYDVDGPDDPYSKAQFAIQALINPALVTTHGNGLAGAPGDMATPSKEKPQPLYHLGRADMNGTPATSNAPSPAPEGANTPVGPRNPLGTRDVNNHNEGSPAPSGRNGGTPAPPNGLAAANGTGVIGGNPFFQPTSGGVAAELQRNAKAVEAEELDAVLPVAPLDIAIMTSIQNAAKADEKKVRDLLGSIMVIGGGAKVPNFAPALEERLRARRPDLHDRILVSKSARDMDEQVVVWKGASVFAKLPTNDSWITGHEYERLGSRCLHQKVLWQY